MHRDRLKGRERNSLSHTLTDTHPDSAGSCRDGEYEQYTVKISKIKGTERNRASYGVRERETERRSNRLENRQKQPNTSEDKEGVREGETPSSNEEGRQTQAGCGMGAVGTRVGKADSL